jgi:hypothetical protein
MQTDTLTSIQTPYISLPNAISNEDYHNAEQYKPFCSSSTLKLLMTSPLYAKYCMEHPEKKETQAMSQGSVYHSMLASLTNKGNLSDFDNEFFLFDAPVNPKTMEPYGFISKAYQEAIESQKIINQNKIPCSQGEKQKAQDMIDMLLNGNPHLSPQINQLIKIGKAEQSHFIQYQGQYFKYRTDLKTSKKIIDWKTTKLESPKPENWSREIVNYNYHISAAFYQFFEFLLTGKWKEFYWVVQESEPPYDFNILSASGWTYELSTDNERTIIETKIGSEMLNKLLEYYILCCEKNQWPGYSIFIQPNWLGQRIGFPDVPGYYKNQIFEFFNDK